jgi:phosphohistidine phosphatase SixA
LQLLSSPYTSEIGVRSLYLVRHAVARDRDSWSQPDRLRPLNEIGWRQAVVLAELLADAGIEVHYSSPALRCRDTLLPLAHGAGLQVLDDTRLLEGGLAQDQGSADAALKGLIRAYFAAGARRAAACSHGDLLPPLLEAAGAAPGSRCPKGGVWRLDLTDEKDRVSQAVYLGRPDPGGGWDQR